MNEFAMNDMIRDFRERARQAMMEWGVATYHPVRDVQRSLTRLQNFGYRPNGELTFSPLHVSNLQSTLYGEDISLPYFTAECDYFSITVMGSARSVENGFEPGIYIKVATQDANGKIILDKREFESSQDVINWFTNQFAPFFTHRALQ